MNSIIAHLQHLLTHPQRHAAHVLDETHDQTRPHHVPADDEQGPDNLQPDLLPVAGHRPTEIRDPERRAPFHGGEDARPDATDQSTDEVRVEDLEGIVDVSEERHAAPGDVHRDPGDGAGEEAEDDGAPAGDEPGRRRDGDETGDHALDGADDGRFAEVDEIAGDPDEGGHGRADVGV